MLHMLLLRWDQCSALSILTSAYGPGAGSAEHSGGKVGHVGPHSEASAPSGTVVPLILRAFVHPHAYEHAEKREVYRVVLLCHYHAESRPLR